MSGGVPIKTTADLHLIANIVRQNLKMEDRATKFLLREHNAKVVSLLYDMDKKERAKYFKDQAFPTYQECQLVIHDKERAIKQLEVWRDEAIAMGYFEEALGFQSDIASWEVTKAIWIDLEKAATNIFDVMWRLGIAETFPGEQHRRESGILGMFGAKTKEMIENLRKGGGGSATVSEGDSTTETIDTKTEELE